MSVRVATAADGPAVVKLMATALADEPLLAWCVGDALAPFLEIGHRLHTLSEQTILVAEDAGQIVAALYLSDPEVELSQSVVEEWVRETTECIGEEGVARLFAVDGQLSHFMPQAHLLSVAQLGVHPTYRWRGHGRALVAQAKEIARQKGIPGLTGEVAGEVSAEFAERLGFKRLGEARTDGLAVSLWVTTSEA